MKKKVEEKIWVAIVNDKYFISNNANPLYISQKYASIIPIPATLTYEIEVPCVHEPVPRFDGPCTQDWVIVCKHCGKIVTTVWSAE